MVLQSVNEWAAVGCPDAHVDGESTTKSGVNIFVDASVRYFFAQCRQISVPLTFRISFAGEVCLPFKFIYFFDNIIIFW
jgi:hypothetical protein